MKGNWRSVERERGRGGRPVTHMQAVQQDTVGLAAGRSPARAAGDRERTRLWSSIWKKKLPNSEILISYLLDYESGSAQKKPYKVLNIRNSI